MPRCAPLLLAQLFQLLLAGGRGSQISHLALLVTGEPQLHLVGRALPEERTDREYDEYGPYRCFKW